MVNVLLGMVLGIFLVFVVNFLIRLIFDLFLEEKPLSTSQVCSVTVGIKVVGDSVHVVLASLNGNKFTSLTAVFEPDEATDFADQIKYFAGEAKRR